MTLLSRIFELSTPPAQLTDQPIQGWVLRWIGGMDSALARTLHDEPGRKPYTVSPFYREDNALRFRVTLLGPELEGLMTLVPPPFLVDSDAFEVVPREPLRSSFETLVREASEEKRLPALRFASPTLFHSKGMDYPLPVPHLVFGSLVHAWNTFSPLPLPVHLKGFIESRITLSRHQIKTQQIILSHQQRRIGFTGRVQFMIRGADRFADQDSVTLMGALIRFAYFAGVGVGTAAGLGQSIPLRDWGSMLSWAI